METPNLKVLLLGWDEPVPVAPSHPSPQALTAALMPEADVTVLVPNLPAEAAAFPAAADVTSLASLTVAQVEAAVAALREATPARTAWKAPAAPYTGSGEAAVPGQTEASAPQPTLDSRPEEELVVPALLLPDAFEAEGAEPSAAEAAALSQADDNLTLDALPEPSAAPPAAPNEAAAEDTPPRLWPPAAERASTDDALAVLRNEADAPGDLNFRVIQYARFATPLAAGKQFEVIYATDWPTWLAALEIRQRTGRPLVLHLHSLAQDRASADDRGWIQALERLALRRADVVLVNSEELCHRVRAVYKLPLRRMRVQPDATDAAEVARVVQATLAELAGSPS